MKFEVLLLGCCFLVLTQCSQETTETSAIEAPKPETLFELKHPVQTSIDFSNNLIEGLNTNILMYEYFYNGAGVVTADFNNDGLIDIYFSSNMEENKLFLNQGSFKFRDVTEEAGVAGRKGPWKTGVSYADVNGDGLLDIYLCYSGTVKEENRANQLFINKGLDANKIPKFVDEAALFGLDSKGYSNQGYFFDYDRDGDLDMFLLNHNPQSLPVLNEVSTKEIMKKDDPYTGVRLFKQDNNHFEDVTVKSGINGSSLTYGLGAGISDINNDGWPDIYLSNDYAIPDYLYINNQNGTFTNKIQNAVGHTSQFSMGNDVADINNDGALEVFTLDMLPEDNARQKLLLSPDNYGKFELNLRSGFYYQYMRNMLQLNNGDGTFSEIGQLAGISNTDWSWAALFADYDNDGMKDLFVTNGYYRDYTNLDFIKYMDSYVQSKGRLKREDVLELIKHMPSSNVNNYIFRNTDGRHFENKTSSWGLEKPSNSNGAAYADLDNDGDLDLVVNNINAPASLYENKSNRQSNNHYLKLALNGTGKNRGGVGAKVYVWNNGKLNYIEQMPIRGYLSGVSPVLNFGLGSNAQADSLLVRWSNGREQMLETVKGDQLITINEIDAKPGRKHPSSKTSPFFIEANSPVNHNDAPTSFNDFKRQPMLNTQLSFSGKCLVKGDINNDGLEDIFAGGGRGSTRELFVQQKSGSFERRSIAAFGEDPLSVDAEAVFVDVNLDGFQDLYVGSGGYHDFEPADERLQDRLYMNDGKGNFTKSKDGLPPLLTSKGAVAVCDINGDKYPDIFVGGRVVPGRYPETPQSFLLINQKNGTFKNEIRNWCPTLERAGMITDATWADLDANGSAELIVAGEFMPVSVFEVRADALHDVTLTYFDKPYSGWWNTIAVNDINKDGRPDIVAGNLGMNSQWQCKAQQPLEMYFDDFDKNGSVDPVLCMYVKGRSYPYLTRDELLDQLSQFRRKFTSYESYANATLSDLFDEATIKKANRLVANHIETTLFMSEKNGTFAIKSLPVEAQYAPVHAIALRDFNHDGREDMLLCGNDSYTRLKIGKLDANYGTLLLGDASGGFTCVPQQASGLKLRNDIRGIVTVGEALVFNVAGGSLSTYVFQPAGQRTNATALK